MEGKREIPTYISFHKGHDNISQETKPNTLLLLKAFFPFTPTLPNNEI